MWCFPWTGATLVLCIFTGSLPLISTEWEFKTEILVTNVEQTQPFHIPVEGDKKERNALIIWPFIDLVPAKGGEWGVPQKKSRLRYTWWWPIQKHWPTHIENICCLIHSLAYSAMVDSDSIQSCNVENVSLVCTVQWCKLCPHEAGDQGAGPVHGKG